MRALSLTEPWATLVALGAKRMETRSWPCYYHGPLAIHSAKNYSKREFADLTHREPFYSALRPGSIYSYPEMHCGSVIAITSIIQCEFTDSIAVLDRLEADPREREFGNYEAGRFAFILGPITRIKPMPAKGSRRLWEWDARYEVLT